MELGALSKRDIYIYIYFCKSRERSRDGSASPPKKESSVSFGGVELNGSSPKKVSSMSLMKNKKETMFLGNTTGTGTYDIEDIDDYEYNDNANDFDEFSGLDGGGGGDGGEDDEYDEKLLEDLEEKQLQERIKALEGVSVGGIGWNLKNFWRILIKILHFHPYRDN